MSILCISASNIEMMRENSASTRACEIVRDMIQEQKPSLDVEILRLVDYEFKFCRMCGKCLPSGRCAHDPAFNQVFEKMIAAQAIFLVCPHYSPLPSKVMAMIEKFQEMAYLAWTNNNEARFPLSGKPLGIIGHGGQGDEALAYYSDSLVKPLAQALGAVGLQVIGVDKDWPSGAAFAIRSLTKPPDSIFVKIEHDWPSVRQRIEPLVRNVLNLSQFCAA